MSEKQTITVLVAPLDWGLGHATRCIPIIRHLLKLQCNVIVATEGRQENLLKTEFPCLNFVHLPGYQILYSNRKRFFVAKIVFQIPKILKAIRFENKWLSQYLVDNKIDLIVSDNRYGFINKNVRSIFLTHQLTIKAKNTWVESLLQTINYRFINKFSECWVPDFAETPSLAGLLSHPKRLPSVPVKYIGAVSRLEQSSNISNERKLLVLLSGPEPQRSVLEGLLLAQLKDYHLPVLFVRGLPGSIETLDSFNNIEFANHLDAGELSEAFSVSEFIISRSGYTTVMDIIRMNKKSILIPTPGQTEQEYLAMHLKDQGWCLSFDQKSFSLHKSLEIAASFPYKMPSSNMDLYIPVLDKVVQELNS